MSQRRSRYSGNHRGRSPGATITGPSMVPESPPRFCARRAGQQELAEHAPPPLGETNLHGRCETTDRYSAGPQTWSDRSLFKVRSYRGLSLPASGNGTTARHWLARSIGTHLFFAGEATCPFLYACTASLRRQREDTSPLECLSGCGSLRRP